ncbi:MAG: sigma-70 family RNA polymerase sigma factor [Akkermansia sp.]
MQDSNNIKDMTDEELVRHAQEGNTKAYDELVIRHSRKLHATLYQMTSNYDDAYDIAQEAFAKAYRSLRFFNGQSAFYTWLHSIAINHARNFLKRRNKRATFSLDDDEFGDHAEKDMHLADESLGSDPEKSVQMSELQGKLRESLKKLSAKHREVVVMHDIKGLSHSEISVALGISEGTLRSRLHYAHQQLQSMLSEYIN